MYHPSDSSASPLKRVGWGQDQSKMYPFFNKFKFSWGKLVNHSALMVPPLLLIAPLTCLLLVPRLNNLWSHSLTLYFPLTPSNIPVSPLMSAHFFLSLEQILNISHLDCFDGIDKWCVQ